MTRKQPGEEEEKERGRQEGQRERRPPGGKNWASGICLLHDPVCLLS